MEGKIPYTDDWRVPGRRLVRTWDEPNAKGESITAAFTLCTGGFEKRSMQRRWKEAGYIDEILDSWWAVEVQATDPDSACWGRYNPMEMPGGAGRVIDFAWMLEGVPESIETLSDEIVRRAFAEAV